MTQVELHRTLCAYAGEEPYIPWGSSVGDEIERLKDKLRTGYEATSDIVYSPCARRYLERIRDPVRREQHRAFFMANPMFCRIHTSRVDNVRQVYNKIQHALLCRPGYTMGLIDYDMPCMMGAAWTTRDGYSEVRGPSLTWGERTEWGRCYAWTEYTYRMSGMLKLRRDKRPGHDGYEICHKCGNPACYCPFHLVEALEAENASDSVKHDAKVEWLRTELGILVPGELNWQRRRNLWRYWNNKLELRFQHERADLYVQFPDAEWIGPPVYNKPLRLKPLQWKAAPMLPL